MTEKMCWNQLLTDKRYTTSASVSAPSTHATSLVAAFQEDITRIIYSSPFRRLQGKTQVHPLPIFDYLRTRLTHSVEVAQIGRIVARQIAKQDSEISDHVEPDGLGDIVYAACLAHDLGNPPFGHIGESAIQKWFERIRDLKQSHSVVRNFLKNDPRRMDFLHFDGNAQGFRILTRLTGWRTSGGLQLSLATLGAFSKYPFSSHYSKKNKRKFGFMSNDSIAANSIFSQLGLRKLDTDKYSRHPLAWIVEAADDVCYLMTDIEDAFRMKRLTLSNSEDLLRPIADGGQHMPRYSSIPAKYERDRISYLRAGAVSSLVDAVCETYHDQSDAIMRGDLNIALVDCTKYEQQLSEIRRTCRKTIYCERNKLQTEAAGHNIIMSMMNLYGTMILEFTIRGEGKLDARNSGIYQLLPIEFRSRLRVGDVYQSLLVLVDYISGMTDRYILHLHQKLSGTSSTLGRMN